MSLRERVVHFLQVRSGDSRRYANLARQGDFKQIVNGSNKETPYLGDEMRGQAQEV